MHSALLVIEIPDLSNPDNRQAWNRLLAAISDNLDNNEDHPDNYPKRFAENVLSFDLNAFLSVSGTLFNNLVERKDIEL